MTRHQIFYFIFSFTLLISCNSKNVKDKETEEKEAVWNSRVENIKAKKEASDSINKLLNWKKNKFDLWKSKDGDLAIKTHEAYEEGIHIDKYISELCCDNEKIMNVIDTLTFKSLGGFLYKDKNNVYSHNSMSDGGNFWIVENADVKTFKVIGNTCYAKDKNHIYSEKGIKMDNIDYKTFKTCNDCGCYAKDKNGYYFWADKIDLNEIDSDVATTKIIEILKKL